MLWIKNFHVNLEPDHIRARRNKLYFEELLEKEEQQLDAPVIKNERPFDGYKSSSEFTTYERLCRGETTHVIMRYSYVIKLSGVFFSLMTS